MNIDLLNEIHQLNPWLKNTSQDILDEKDYISRVQADELLDKEWEPYWTILVGPRRAGKTTIGNFLSKCLVTNERFTNLLYLNCDYPLVRQWLSSPIFISEALDELSLKAPILFIDEVQRLENPGLLLKAVIDLGLPIKHIATGSSQLEIKSKVQEHLTGRQLTAIIYPMSHEEWPENLSMDELIIYGAYPQVINASKKEWQLTEIYNRYIQKDIIEILKVGKPDVFQHLISLMAHHSGQLINYNQLALDCKVSVTMIRNHLDILEHTFVLKKIRPFVGYKRTELTSNPIYYFIDNGFRNVALKNFSSLASRTDAVLLIENFIFQEILKFKEQRFINFVIHYWRTKSGAGVNFVLYKNEEQFIPIEVQYRRFTKSTVPRGFRSFIQAYQPKEAIVVTKDLISKLDVDGCLVHFIPLQQLSKIFQIIKEVFNK